MSTREYCTFDIICATVCVTYLVKSSVALFEASIWV